MSNEPLSQPLLDDYKESAPLEVNTKREGWQQYISLLKKNGLLVWRRKLSTFCEMIVPILIFAVLVFVRIAVKKDHKQASLHLGYFNSLDLSSPSFDYLFTDNHVIMFGPESSQFANELRDSMAAYFANYSICCPDRLVMIKDNKAFEDYVLNSDYPNGKDLKAVKAALFIDSDGSYGTKPWEYSIRMNASSFDVPPTSFSPVNKLQVGFDGEYFDDYSIEGFSLLQRYTDEFILMKSGVTESIDDAPNMVALPFPTSAYTEDLFADSLKSFLGLFLTVAYLWPASKIVKALVQEKETRMREVMKIMGLSEAAYFFSWLTKYVIFFAIQSLLITLLTSNSVFKYSNKMIIFVFFFLFGLSVYAFAFFVSTLFSKAKIAATTMAVVFFITYFLAFTLNDSSPLFNRLAASVIPTICVSQAASPIFSLEAASIGAQWSNIGNTYDNFKIIYAFTFLLLDTGIFLLLGLYVDMVFPGEFGIPLPWYFPFQFSYWFPSSIRSVPSIELPSEDIAKREKVDVSDKTVGIAIRNLRKVFKRDGQNELVAVNNLNLDIYEDQVLAFLGANGAGKTTTMNMLMGMLSSSGGTAYLYGMDIVTDIAAIRRQIGVCPQHDVLYDDLTVREHLRFFSFLKGVPADKVDSEVAKMIQTVGLTEKVNALVSSLSGGQKRKLSVGIAFIGGSRLVILDEPTSGMDPYSRRSTWDLIRRYKRGRTIMLTTHFMDEADSLGDRIAIMAHGNLVCCGSSLFLKQTYGVGYTMTVSKTKGCDKNTTKALIDLVKRHVQSAEVLSNAADEISFRLIFDEAPNFPALFEALEDDFSAILSEKQFGVDTFGISVTTLEEVFLRAGEESDFQEKPEREEITMSRSNAKDTSSLWAKHLKALLLKRWNDTKRDRKTLFWQILYPVLICIAGIALIKYAIPTKYPSLALTVANQYDSPDRISFGVSINSTLDYESIMSPDALTSPSVGIGCEPQAETCFYTVAEFSQLLLDSRDFEQSKYGAFIFSNGSDIYNSDVFLFANTTAVHSLPTYISVLDSARLKSSKGQTITINSHPFPLTKTELTFNNATLSLIIGIAFAFVPASFGAFIVMERMTKTKHQQLISGVSVSAYWVSNYIWDFVNFMIPSVVLICLLYGFNISTLIGENMPVVAVGVVLYGLSVIPFTYTICQLTFKDKSSAQNTLLLLYIISGSILLIASIILRAIPSTKHLGNNLQYLFRLFPNYAFAEIISGLMVRNSLALGMRHTGPWDMDISGKAMIYMAIQSVAFFSLTLVIEWVKNAKGVSLLEMLRNATIGGHITENHLIEEDEDVAEERLRVQSGGAVDDSIVLQNIRKVYHGGVGGTSKVAVSGLSFGIPTGQCFGFLGLNGAGKSTTIKMLTLDEFPTSGSAQLNGLDIKKNREKVRHLLGYCPQFDALLLNLTAREQLHLYASIKGVSSSQIDFFVSELIEQIGLGEYADLPCGGYSGGNKRKLSVGIALIGDPPIVFLDEPSTGMDPRSRRAMWNLISTTMKGRSVILTTHSMEESEALCSNIGIMVGGRLKCLGSGQRLKNRFGDGFQLDMNVPKHSHSMCKEFIKEQFPSSKLVEVQDMNLKFMIPRSNNTISAMFRLFENEKERLDIEEYSLSETSLEQVFIRFARDQDEERGVAEGFRVDID